MAIIEGEKGWGEGANPSPVYNKKVRHGCLQVTSYVTIYILHILSPRYTHFSRIVLCTSCLRHVSAQRNFHTKKNCTSVVRLLSGINVWNAMIGNLNTHILLYILATATHVAFVKVYSWWRPLQGSKHVQNEFLLINAPTELTCDWWIQLTSLILLMPTVWTQLKTIIHICHQT